MVLAEVSVWELSFLEVVFFVSSEYIWCDPNSGRPVNGNGRRSFYGSEFCSSGGSPVVVSCYGVSRAAAAGPAGEATAAAEAAAAGEEPVQLSGLFKLQELNKTQ